MEGEMTSMATDQDTEEEETTHHPSVSQYVEIGIVLAGLTAVEVGLFFAPVVRQVTVPALLILTVLKFLLVVAWFMHLRFDHRLFRTLFLIGLALALTVFAVVVVIFAVSRSIV